MSITLDQYRKQWFHNKDTFARTTEYEPAVPQAYPHLPWRWARVDRAYWPERVDWALYMRNVTTEEEMEEFLNVMDVPPAVPPTAELMQLFENSVMELTFVEMPVLYWLYNGFVRAIAKTDRELLDCDAMAVLRDAIYGR